MIKTIILDYGGVLGSEADAWDKEFKNIPQLTGLPTQKIKTLFEKFWPDLKIGKSSLADFWHALAEQSPQKPHPKDLHTSYASHVSINRQVLHIAQKLKKQHQIQLVILANESKEGMVAKIKKFQLFRTFERIYCSANLRLAKPDPKIFQYVLKDLAATPNETLLIDNQENNIAIATKLNISSFLYQNLPSLKKFFAKHFPP